MDFKAFVSKTTSKARSSVDKVSVTVKLYAKKNALSDKLNGLYDTLGKICYFNAIGENSDTHREDINAIVEDITATRKELAVIEEDIRERTGKKLCVQCGKELQKDVSFCPYCGFKANNEDKSDLDTEDIF